MKVYVGDEDSGCGSVPRSSMVLAVQLLRMDLGEFLCIDPAEKLVNRGFVNGPLLTLYGTGAVMVYLILRPFEANVWALYFGGVIVATVLEYVRVLMETIFHAHWWDYSNQKFNFQGKICLSSSIAWGFFTLGLFYILQPIAVKVVNLVSDTTGEIIVSVVTVCYLVDFGFSAAAAFQLGQKMRSLEKTWGGISEISAEIPL